MRRLEDHLERKADALARLVDKGTPHVRSVLKYSIGFTIDSGTLFAASIDGIHAARTNAGGGVAWFAAAVTGLAFISALASTAGVVRELLRRRRTQGLP